MEQLAELESFFILSLNKFSIAKIAELANVTVAFVKQIEA